MTNVEYRCPTCGTRLFAAPGGTRIRCPKCQGPYEQHEFPGGTDAFNFKDSHGVVAYSNPVEHKLSLLVDDTAKKEFLTEEYNKSAQKLGKKRADGRWNVDTLLEEYQKLQDELNPLTIDTSNTPAETEEN